MSALGRMATYSRDYQAAKLLGIPIARGWRKELSRRDLTPDQLEAIKAATVKRDHQVRLRRMTKGVPAGDCPFTLHPEEEIRGELFHRLRAAGINAKMEVSVPSDSHSSGVMRIDIGIFENGRLVRAIECKREGCGLGPKTLQAGAYRDLKAKYGLTLHFVSSIKQIEQVVSHLTVQ